MTIEITKRGNMGPVIVPDDHTLNFTDLSRIVEYPRRVIITAALNAGVLRQRETGIANFYAFAGDLPLIIEKLQECKSLQVHVRGIDPSNDFSFRTPSGSNVVFKYSK